MRFGLNGRSQSRQSITVLAVLAVVSIVLALSAFVHVTTHDAYDNQYLLRTAEQRVLSQRIAKYALSAAAGDEESFGLLQESRDSFDRLIGELKNGDPAAGLPARPDLVDEPLKELENDWLALRANADEILDNRQAIVSVGEFISVITEFVPQLEELSEQVVDVLIKNKAPQRQVSIAARQLMLAQRIENNVTQVLKGGATTAAAIDQFSQDADLFGRVLEGMLKGDKRLKIDRVADADGEQRLREVALLFSSINDHAEEIVQVTPALLPALEAASQVALTSDQVNESAQRLIDAFADSPSRLRFGPLKVGPGVVTVLGLVAVALLALLAYALVADARRQERRSAEQNERNQEAILRLLDEMGDLADGDLTVTATVTEDITGAIADSINYAIEALRSLVTTINETSVQVSASAEESRATAMHLAEASEHQAEQIASASNSMSEIATTMDEMANNAGESADVAQRSVDIAHKGSDTVRSTIKGMDNIREQIQETSKRIKRLGESSQEIGDIVELIDDIADQTNILALNAAMQAAMAGEAGRGFAVVADEVQRLAERSSNATKQIEALVKTIQADTNEAVSSMEASTSEVVSGAKLAEDAGEALQEIESVSNYIADLTQRIAASARQQSEGTTQVNDTMGVIKEITSQTTEGTNQTATSIGNLADLADDLRKSVAGFRLPD